MLLTKNWMVFETISAFLTRKKACWIDKSVIKVKKIYIFLKPVFNIDIEKASQMLIFFH